MSGSDSLRDSQNQINTNTMSVKYSNYAESEQDIIDWANNAPGPLLVIIRGPQGSGKTTFAKTAFVQYPDPKGFVVIEADDYFTKGNNYKFDASKISDAHRYCKTTVENCLLHGHEENPPKNKVIVSNTFIMNEHVIPYIAFCNNNNIPFHVFRIDETRFQNRHGVDQKIVKQKIDEFNTQRLPGGLSETSVLPPVDPNLLPKESTEGEDNRG